MTESGRPNRIRAGRNQGRREPGSRAAVIEAAQRGRAPMVPRHVLATVAGLAMLGSALAQDNPISSTPQLPATGAYPVRQDSSQWLGSNLTCATAVSTSNETTGCVTNLA